MSTGCQRYYLRWKIAKRMRSARLLKSSSGCEIATPAMHKRKASKEDANTK